MKWIAAILLPIICLFAFFLFSSTPVSTNSVIKQFVINQGDNITTIATRLEKNGLIRNRYVFILRAKISGLNRRLQAGLFKLAANLSTQEIIVKLSTNGTKDYWFRIPEGSRLEEFSPSADFSLAAKPFEGKLFPDSYLVPEYFTPAETINMILTNFEKKIKEAKAGSQVNLSDDKVLILASLLEREGRSLESKKMIAGILLNRLQANIALQVDATVQFARDSQAFPPKYWLPVTKSDLKIKSPYNTYQNSGLPPKPICNPGLNSLLAAFHPTSSDYLYYITGTDSQMHYAKTLEEHNQNINKYLK